MQGAVCSNAVLTKTDSEITCELSEGFGEKLGHVLVNGVQSLDFTVVYGEPFMLDAWCHDDATSEKQICQPGDRLIIEVRQRALLCFRLFCASSFPRVVREHASKSEC